MAKQARKHEKPLTLDMEFDEALERFVQTDTDEINDDRAPEDVALQEDDKGSICLSDLFVMAGRPKNRRANDWHRGARAKALKQALVEKITGDSRNQAKDVEKSLYYTTGKGGGTKSWAHPVLALDYAEFVEPALGIAVRETFLRYKAGDVSLAAEILDGLSEQSEFDAMRIELRDLLKEHNKQSAGAAADAGVTNFEAYNGAGLRGLYGGLTKKQLLKRKGLPQDANRLDFAGHEELAANYFKATQAIAKLRREGIKGQIDAEDAHEEVGQAVRQTIKGLGGTMPEDEPAIDDVKEARKRLKAAEKAQLTKPKDSG